jgi:dTDP-4-dehydrorhamnose reductase
MMRILVTGKNGQVDTSLQARGDQLGLEIYRIGLPEIDLSIISSAAYTAVDKAEVEPDLAQKINGDAPGELARLAEELRIPILHLSTDYVFAGEKDSPYRETDVPAPIGVYGKTKLSGEDQIRAATENHVILRTAWVYSPYGNNFVKTMLRLGETREELTVVGDQHGCPTYAPEIAQALLTIAQQVVIDPDPAIRGTFHLTGQGETTWAHFATAIFDGAAARGLPPVRIRAITTAEYPTAAKRPANSRLDGDKLDAIYGLRLDPWQISLDECLNRLVTVKSEGES